MKLSSTICCETYEVTKLPFKYNIGPNIKYLNELQHALSKV